MSNEQNVNEFLKILENFASTLEQAPPPIEKSEEKHEEISDEKLQSQLKDQYFNDKMSSDIKQNSVSEYVIYSDFLDEIAKNAEDFDLQQEKSVKEDNEENIEDITKVADFDENTEDTIQANVTDDDSEDIIEEGCYDDEVFVESILFDNDEYESENDQDDVDDIDTLSDSLLDALPEDDAEDDFDMEFLESDELPPDNVDYLIAGLKPSSDIYNKNSPDYFEDESIEADVTAILTDSVSETSDNQIFFENTETTDTAVIDNSNEFSETSTENKQVNNRDDISKENNGLATVNAEEQKYETFLGSMRKIGIDFSSDDIVKNNPVDDLQVSGAQEIANEEISDNNISDKETGTVVDEDIDLSTINLMMQFCERDELKKQIGDNKVDEFLKQEQTIITEKVTSPAYNGNEYVSSEQNSSINEAYKKSYTFSLLILCGCVLITLLSFIHELIPLLNMNVSGIMNYYDYSAVYALVGLQLVIFIAAISYKKLWSGIKCAFSLKPTRHSLVAVLLVLTALYDIIIVIILAFSQDELPNMLNSVACFCATLSAVIDFFELTAEMKAFSVYSSGEKKYTLVKESRQGSVAEKMYNGGLESSKNVYSVKHIDFPIGFFNCISTKKDNKKRLTVMIILSITFGIIATIISAIIGTDAYTASAVFMLCLYAVLPLHLIFSDNLPYIKALFKLARRGSAFAGKEMPEKYSSCDIMVFSDLHMFKKCKTEEVGIVMYDTGVGYLVLGCLDALYSKIGGPLSGMKMNLPDVFKFTDVKVRRITRNGIEAIIERKHVLIVGDHAFLQRYGLSFPENEVNNGRSTLCVSLNGKVTAKLSVKYQTEPIFEMLAERLYAEGVSCTIQTYDPLINSSMISSGRTIGDCPISVVHCNTDDFYSKSVSDFREELDGVVCCSSRLKLAETQVWFKKIRKVNKLLNGIMHIFSGVAIAAVVLLTVLKAAAFVCSLHIFAFFLLELGCVLGIMMYFLPPNNFFTEDALYFELEKKHSDMMKKDAKKSKNKQESEINE